MITYDILQSLERNGIDLMNSISGMNSGINERTVKQSHEKLLGALRKIIIASEMSGRGIICISGLQGAGKTTLIKNFYELSDEYFNVTLGRGEKIPVFICERANCKEVEMYAVCLNKTDSGYERCTRQLNEEEFKEASSGNEIYANIMYLELCVPFKHLNNESYAFMLLPGFEKKNDYWQNLIDFSVKCSDTSIFVFNESSFSKYDNQVLLNKIKEKFGESLIYAISNSDSSADGNQEVRKNCIDVMKIASGEEDRVICVGEFPTKEENDKWICQLKSAINKYCNSIETARKNCAQYIYETIEDDMRPEISNIKDSLGSDSGDALQIHLENSSYLNAFDKVIADRKKRLEKELEGALDASFEYSREKLEKLFLNENYAKDHGVRDKRVLVRTVFGNSIKDVQLARRRVEAALKREDDTYDFQHAFFKAVSSKAIEAADHNEYRNILEDSAAEEKSVFDTSSSSDLYDEAAKVQNEIMNDIGTLLSRKSNDMEQLKHENIADTMKVIAELGTEHFILVTLQQSCNYNSKLEIPDAMMSKLQINQKKITKEMGKVDKVILGALGITGIDILEDGAINAVPKIASSLGISASFVGAAVAVIAAGTVGVAVVNDVNRLQRTELNSAENMIASIHVKIKRSYLSAYDDAMNSIRDCIEDKLIAISGVNKKMVKKTNAMNAIYRLETDLDTISKEVIKDSYDIRNAFAG